MRMRMETSHQKENGSKRDHDLARLNHGRRNVVVQE